MHLDMDAFYASVEVLDNPDLSGKCLVVGGHSKRGVVAAASYEARRYGIHSAMPMFQARKRCADIVIVPPRRKRYQAVSRRVMALIKEVSPLVEQVSIDEAYVDITGCQRLHGPPTVLARDLKRRIKEVTQLTCSVGIAPNKFLAKIASDMEKPDGLTIIPAETVPDFIHTLAVEKVPGVGKRTHEVLRKMGIRTLGDIIHYPEPSLHRRLGKFGHRLIQLARGIEAAPVTPQTPVKSISGEETLETDTRDKRKLQIYLMQHAEDVGHRLRQANMKARRVTLKIKHSDFKQVTRSKTMKQGTNVSEIIYREAKQLLDHYHLTRPVRLIGMGVSALTETDHPVQRALFDSEGDRTNPWQQVDQVMDAITEKFGKGSISKARLKEDDP
jgi:DNA polymerase-4